MADKASEGFRTALVEICARQEVGPSCREKKSLISLLLFFFLKKRKNIKLVSREVGGPGRN